MESTTIYQLSTGMPLSASSDDENTSQLLSLKKQTKKVVSKLSNDSESIGTIIDGSHAIHYYLDPKSDTVCLVITDKEFPSKLALSYLSEINTEFVHVYGNEMQKFSNELRPYQFVSFDSFINKTKKVYGDDRARGNLDKLNNELGDVKRIMNKNIEELLYRGDSLDKLHDLSSSLKDQSLKYKKYAEKINWQLLLKQYAPISIVALIFLFILYRFFF